MAEHLTSPRDGVPALSDTIETVREATESLAAGHGPIAVDTERASGFRFDDRAFLVQLRRQGSGTHLVDPATVPQAGAVLAPLMDSSPWILHAAHSDLPALTSLGWRTPELHDTQIAGRLLGYGQIGLAGMLEEFLGVTVAKDKGREDWSARPIPGPMLTYAALDVEMLIELRDVALSRLDDLGRTDWYRQECAHVRAAWTHPVPEPDWRKLRGLGHVRDPRELETARRLIDARTAIARESDVPPEHVLRGSSILELAQGTGRGGRAGSSGRQIDREIAGGSRLVRSSRGSVGREVKSTLTRAMSEALRQAAEADASSLPGRVSTSGGFPDHRTWERDHPIAFHLLGEFREALSDVSESTGIRTEDLLTVRSLRSVAWETSRAVADGLLADAASEHLDEPGDDQVIDLDTVLDADPVGATVDVAVADPVGALEDALGRALESRECRAWQRDLLVDAFLPVLAGQVT